MPRRSEEVRQARADTIDAVLAGLSARGWSAVPGGSLLATAAVRRLGGGILAVAEVSHRGGYSYPEDWPARLHVSVGVGFEPVLAQLPLLGETPYPFVLRDPRWDDELAADVASPADVAAAAAQLLGYVDTCGIEYASTLADAASLFRALEQERASLAAELDGESDEDDLAERSEPVRLTVMALGVSPAAAAHELRACLDAGDSPVLSARCVRQLRRWLNAGAPAAPPLDETLAVLAPVDQAQRSLRDRRERRDRDAAARARRRTRSVAATYEGHDVDELVRLLAAASADDGEPTSPTTLAVAAHGALEERSILGRLRNVGRAGSMLLDVGRSLMAPFSGDIDELVAALRPPADGLPVRSGQRWLLPDLRAGVDDALRDAHSAARRRMGPVVLCTVRLDRGAGLTTVNLGDHVVADVRDEAPLGAVWRAAELMDERPYVSAWLSMLGPGGSPLLELRLPD